MMDPTHIRSIPTTPRTDQTDPLQRAGKAQPTSTQTAAGTGSASDASNVSFAELLRARQGVAPSQSAPGVSSEAIRFSGHAQTRLQSRQIDLQSSHLDRLQSAVGRAAAKGSKDALVLMDDMAFVVSVTNRTVVTVVDKANMKQNVFTNIDSAVVA